MSTLCHVKCLVCTAIGYQCGCVKFVRFQIPVIQNSFHILFCHVLNTQIWKAKKDKLFLLQWVCNWEEERKKERWLTSHDVVHLGSWHSRCCHSLLLSNFNETNSINNIFPNQTVSMGFGWIRCSHQGNFNSGWTNIAIYLGKENDIYILILSEYCIINMYIYIYCKN